MTRKQNTNDKRLEHFERLLSPASADPMLQPIDPDFSAIDKEFCSLAQAPHWKGNVKIEPKDEVREYYGRDYTFREHWALAVRRALEKRGYTGEELDERVAMWIAFSDQLEQAGGGGNTY